MIKSLILIRHAKAEEASEAFDDSARELTTAGIRAAKAALPRMMGLVEEPKSYSVWSSPATRAWQTAEIAADALGLKRLEKRADLYSQESSLMMQVLNQEEGNLVLVGHNPFIEELASDLTSHHLHFGTCAAACYNFPDGSFGSAELAWFVQGPDTSHWETVVALENGLQAAARKASSAVWLFFDDPNDSERLHEARVALRRLATLLDFTKPYLKKKQYRWLKRTVDDFYRDLSALKKLVIPSQTATQWHSIPFVTPEAQRMYDRLRISEAERNRILARLLTPTRQQALHKTNHILRSPAWNKTVKADGLDPAAVRKRCKKLRRTLKQQIEALPEGEADSNRKLRKLEERLGFLDEGFAAILKK